MAHKSSFCRRTRQRYAFALFADSVLGPVLSESTRSMQFNPIELGFGWLKKYIRRHFEDLGGNSKAVEKAVYQGIRKLTRDTAAGFFRKSGYFIKHVDEDAVLVVAASVVAVMVTLL